MHRAALDALVQHSGEYLLVYQYLVYQYLHVRKQSVKGLWESCEIIEIGAGGANFVTI